MHQRVPIKTVLIPVEFAESSREAFYAGVSLATQFGADTLVLHVAEPVRAFDFDNKKYVETAAVIERVEAVLRTRIDELWQEGGLQLVDRRRVHAIVHGAAKAADEILAVAREKKVDLIVMASCHGGGVDSPTGSTTDVVMRSAPCSVLIVRARREKSA
jgi:nucleotide-binding universal stress UspA family protein